MIKLFVNTADKKFMFNLGRLFARGEKIYIENLEDVQTKILEEEKLGYAKSFNMMIKFWQDNKLAPNICGNYAKIKNLFLICPVRRATEEEKTRLAATIKKYEDLGYNVHYPERDTNQNPQVNNVNTGGFNICLQNASAIASAKTVAMYYNKESTGSMFDLGVTYELAKHDSSRKFILENNIYLENDNYIDKKVNELSLNIFCENEYFK